MKVVEAYSDETVSLDGRTYPASCLLEDEDGFRLLVVPTDVPARTWVRAHTAGAVAILCTGTHPMGWITTESFMMHRTENVIHGTFDVEQRFWTQTSGLQSYRELLIEERFIAPIDDGGPGPEYIHLHNHTEYSPLDGLQTTIEAAGRAQEIGSSALAIADHGGCFGHPGHQRACDDYGLKPIFGMEAYFVADRAVRENQYDYHHLCLFAQDEQGLRNLWAMSTEAYATGFYGKPRLDWEVLQRLNKGILATTACLGGPLSKDLLAGRHDAAVATLARLGEIFGDRLYLELQTVQLQDQIRLNEMLVGLSRSHGVPLLASSDAHYSRPQDKTAHKAWLSMTSHAKDGEEAYFSDEQYDHMQSYDEARHSLRYLPSDVVTEALENTVKLAARTDVRISGKPTPPIYHKPTEQHPDPVRHDEDALFEKCFANFQKKTKGKRESPEVYLARMEREMRLLVIKGFCGYYLMESDQTTHAKANGVLVGPGRGSGGGSLVAYFADITDIDPVEADLLFERFMTEGRVSLPDFDIDYPSSRKQFMFDYVRDKYGADYVAIVGTHLRLKSKGIIRDVARAMKDVLPENAYLDIDKVSKIITAAEAGTAGLGLAWDDLWTQHEEELGPYREKYPDLFAMADRLVGRLKTYAKHAAGVIISTDEPLTGTLPLRLGDEEEGAALVTQFEMNDLEALGLVKFDLLNLRTLDTIQMCVDLIEQRTGFRVDVYSWLEEYEDPQVWDEISLGRTLGIFQIETTSGTRLIKQFKPQSVADLADAITLVRPGPKNSGLTDTYMKRRDGEEAVTFPEPRLEQVLGKTYGCMLYQEDIMQVCMVLAGYNSNEADAVRKILGKKQVEKVKKAGEEFVSRAVANGTDQVVADHLWQQMAEFAKYSFNRAHAFAYAILGYWTAWLKFHYPVEFLTAALSTVDKDRIPDFIGEARRMGYAVQPPDINESGLGFTAGSMAVRYGLDAIKGVREKATLAITQGQPYASWEDFLERKGKAADMGVVRTLARIGAFDSLVPNRRGLETVLEAEKEGLSSQCTFMVPGLSGPQNRDKAGAWGQVLPCTFDWANEPVEIGRSGKPKKAKPLPKKCAKSCRQYTAPEPMDPATVEPYSDEDIREIEMDLLGVYLSSTPFERLDPKWREDFLSTADDVLTGPNGDYYVGAIIKGVREARTRAGNLMAFLTLTTERGELDCAVFDEYQQVRKALTKGRLCVVELSKTARGQTFNHILPL